MDEEFWCKVRNEPNFVLFVLFGNEKFIDLLNACMYCILITCHCHIPRYVKFMKKNDSGYPHDGRADKNPYPHDRRADKDSLYQLNHNLIIITNKVIMQIHNLMILIFIPRDQSPVFHALVYVCYAFFNDSSTV